MNTLNKELRRQIVDMVVRGRDGHIPSAFSIVDIIEHLYSAHLKYNPSNPNWTDRDYFILSKGHGCLALYVVLEKFGVLTAEHTETFCTPGGILGEHPDCTKVPGVEASTGSLGHGMPFATGIALGLKIRGMQNRVLALCGDGECQEGTIWEAANIAANQSLDRLTVIVDWNGSAAQLMPKDDLPAKWEAFGWDVSVCDGHDMAEMDAALTKPVRQGQPRAIIARTVKGKGVPAIEGHGSWHHRIPTEQEYRMIMEALA